MSEYLSCDEVDVLLRKLKCRPNCCATCTYWRGIDGPKKSRFGGLDWTGACHRYPPTMPSSEPDLSDGENRFPESQAINWCGEWTDTSSPAWTYKS